MHRPLRSRLGAGHLTGGALLAGRFVVVVGAAPAPAASEEALRRYGLGLGVAFQIIDDIIDITMDEAVAGKPTGVDLARGNATLAVLRYLRTASAGERRLVEEIVTRRDPGRLDRLRQRLLDSGAVDAAIKTARDIADGATRELEGFGPSKARAGLERIPQLVVGQVDPASASHGWRKTGQHEK